MQLEMRLFMMQVVQRLCFFNKNRENKLPLTQSLPCLAKLLIILKQKMVMFRLSLAVPPINFE